MNIFNIVLVWPLTNVLLLLYQGFLFLHVPYALGFSIIGLTLLSRLVLYPFTASQIRTSQKMQKITPHLNKLKETHKGDAKRLQEETMKLYKEHGVNPAAGCLPMIIQLPLIWSLYSLLQHVVNTNPAKIVTETNHIAYFPFLRLTHVWDQTFFGIPLGTSPSHLISSIGIIVLIFPVLTAGFQFIQSKMMFSPVANPLANSGQVADKKEKPADDFSSIMQSQSMYIFPLMIGFFSWSLPFGLTLYWNTFTIFGIIQQYLVAGLGGLEPHVQKLFKTYGRTN